MSRNAHCNCLCHGADNNLIGDQYFSCKNCYAANHMGNLPRQSHEEPRKGKPAGAKKGPRKPRVSEEKLDKAIKVVAAGIMNDLADAAVAVKREWVQKTPGTSSMTPPVLDPKN